MRKEYIFCENLLLYDFKNSLGGRTSIIYFFVGVEHQTKYGCEDGRTSIVCKFFFWGGGRGAGQSMAARVVGRALYFVVVGTEHRTKYGCEGGRTSIIFLFL